MNTVRPITCNFCRRVIQAALVVSIVVLGACSGPAQSPTPTGPAVPITQVDGAATLIQATGRSSDLAQTAVLGVGDTLYTRPDTTVTLQLTDGSTLQMGPDSQLTLLLIREEDQRPLFRLLKGTVAGQSRSKSFIVQAYLEAAIKFQMVQSDLSVLPHDGDSRFRLGLNDQILDAVVEAGEVDVQSGTQQVTLPAGWQAIVEPQKPFRIVQVITPTPPPAGSAILTPTLIRIITIAPTNTLRPTSGTRTSHCHSKPHRLLSRSPVLTPKSAMRARCAGSRWKRASCSIHVMG